MATEIEELKVKIVVLENLCRRLVQMTVRIEAEMTHRPEEKIKSELNESLLRSGYENLRTKGMPPQMPAGTEEIMLQAIHKGLH